MLHPDDSVRIEPVGPWEHNESTTQASRMSRSALELPDACVSSSIGAADDRKIILDFPTQGHSSWLAICAAIGRKGGDISAIDMRSVFSAEP